MLLRKYQILEQLCLKLEQLKALLGSTGGGTRSPIRKPLTDLRMPQNAKGRINRPHFEWSAEDPNVKEENPGIRLFWCEKGIEHAVKPDEAPEAGWTPYPPRLQAIDPMTAVQAEFDALSPEDQKIVMEAQRQARLKKLQDKMSGLSLDDLDSLARSAQPVDVKAKRSA